VIEVLRRDLTDGHDFDRARVGEQHVDLVRLFGDQGIQTVQIIEIGNIALNRRHASADLCHLVVSTCACPQW